MKASHEPDRVRARPILLTATAIVVASSIGVLAAWELTKSGSARRGADERAARLPHPPAEVNAIEMSLFRPGPTGSARRRPPKQRLEKYGWVDRERGIVHVPIARAFELYLAEHNHENQAITAPSTADRGIGGRDAAARIAAGAGGTGGNGLRGQPAAATGGFAGNSP